MEPVPRAIGWATELAALAMVAVAAMGADRLLRRRGAR